MEGTMVDKSYQEAEAKRRQDEEDALNHPVNIDGHKLTLRDIFGDAYAAKEFRTKLKLLNSKASGEPDGMDPQMEKQVKKKKTQEQISDELFGPGTEKNPVGMDGE